MDCGSRILKCGCVTRDIDGNGCFCSERKKAMIRRQNKVDDLIKIGRFTRDIETIVDKLLAEIKLDKCYDCDIRIATLMDENQRLKDIIKDINLQIESV